MENIMLCSINRYLDELKRIRDRSYERHRSLQDYSSWSLKQGTCYNGVMYYNAKKPGSKELEYLGNQSNETVIRIQEERYLREFLKIADSDIKLIQDFLEKYESVSFVSINSRLPKVYRNKKALNARDRKRAAMEWKSRKEKEKAKYPVFRPEELKHLTADGKYVRSLGELLIYNYLYEAGYTFVYEMPLEGTTRRFYPDFTILSEIDYKTEILIEHQGMMGKSEYKERAETREYDYWYNGFLPNRDVYFTYTDNRGVLDMTPIVEILNSRVRPLTNQNTA